MYYFGAHTHALTHTHTNTHTQISYKISLQCVGLHIGFFISTSNKKSRYTFVTLMLHHHFSTYSRTQMRHVLCSG
jgi:hypothetical protein